MFFQGVKLPYNNKERELRGLKKKSGLCEIFPLFPTTIKCCQDYKRIELVWGIGKEDGTNNSVIKFYK